MIIAPTKNQTLEPYETSYTNYIERMAKKPCEVILPHTVFHNKEYVYQYFINLIFLYSLVVLLPVATYPYISLI